MNSAKDVWKWRKDGKVAKNRLLWYRHVIQINEVMFQASRQINIYM